MKKIKIISLWIFGLILLLVLGFYAYLQYRGHCLKNIKDTHDLEFQADSFCKNFIKKYNSAGLAIGIVKDGKVYMQGYGYADKDRKIRIDSNTIFEIGSISKVFTAEIAEIFYQRKMINWEDNIVKYFPENTRPKIDDNTTLLNLITHTSGYPRLPEIWFPKLDEDTCNPYKALNIEDLSSYLKNPTEKTKPNKENIEYSNLGNGILGHILEWKTGKSFEELLQTEICTKLNMSNTSFKVKDESRFATGYDLKGIKTCHWDLPILYSAGAIRSNTSDMVKFMKANLNETELNSIFIATQQSIYSKGIMQGKIGKGWQIEDFMGPKSDLGDIIWHNGGTGGFNSFLGMLPEYNCGIILLSNQSLENNKLDYLGFKLLTIIKSVSFK
jgi:serine-type D-Ala-D-Ala carboxypeptidase/endopeptidase